MLLFAIKAPIRAVFSFIPSHPAAGLGLKSLQNAKVLIVEAI